MGHLLSDPLGNVDPTRALNPSTKTIGCLRDLVGIGDMLELEENSLTQQDVQREAKPSLMSLFGDELEVVNEPPRPSTPPSSAAPPSTALDAFSSDPSAAQSSVVTLGCIRDLFSSQWDKSDDEGYADFLQALRDAAPDEPPETNDPLKTGTAFRTIATGLRDDKPSLASIFGVSAEPAPAPAAVVSQTATSVPLPLPLSVPQAVSAVAPPVAEAPPAPASRPGTELSHPPCAHNNWDNVRVKKGFFGLRCRTCSSNWKVPIKAVAKCPAFFNGYCPNGVSCPLPHIHRYKNPEKEKQNARAMVVSQLRATEAAAGAPNAPAGKAEAALQADSPPQEDAAMEVGVAVHVSPSRDEPEGSFLRMGGVGTIVEPGEKDGKWHVETRDHGKMWIGEAFLRVAWKCGSTPTAQDQLEATFAVPLSVLSASTPQLSPERAELLQKLVSEKLGDPVFTEAMASRPCNHNNWDNVRIVKGKIGLRCRSCGTHWKADVSSIIKCPAFFNGYCPNGVSCPLPHIHRYKNKAKEEAKARVVALTLQQAAGDGTPASLEASSPTGADGGQGQSEDPKAAMQYTPLASEFLQSAAPQLTTPCSHNSWTQKKDKAESLQCDVCDETWALDLKHIAQCPAYFNGYCHAGPTCPMAHVKWCGSNRSPDLAVSDTPPDLLPGIVEKCEVCKVSPAGLFCHDCRDKECYDCYTKTHVDEAKQFHLKQALPHPDDRQALRNLQIRREN